MTVSIEVCAGNIEDIQVCEELKVDRIELNSGLFLGGLTPSLGLLREAKAITQIPIVSMVRPRGGGFIYNELEAKVMMDDARMMLEAGSDGLAFGFLTESLDIDVTRTKDMVALCHSFNREAVFHRAFDMVKDPYSAIEALIECGVDRILTSGLKDTAVEGRDLLKVLHEKYGHEIELLMGSGINASNVSSLMNDTGINQVHASFKTWFNDPSTFNDALSYAYCNKGSYEGVSKEKLKEFLSVINKGEMNV